MLLDSIFVPENKLPIVSQKITFKKEDYLLHFCSRPTARLAQTVLEVPWCHPPCRPRPSEQASPCFRGPLSSCITLVGGLLLGADLVVYTAPSLSSRTSRVHPINIIHNKCQGLEYVDTLKMALMPRLLWLILRVFTNLNFFLHFTIKDNLGKLSIH